MPIKEVFDQYMLQAFASPQREDCPDEDILQALAKFRQPADYSTSLHVASCSECYQEHLHFCRD